MASRMQALNSSSSYSNRKLNSQQSNGSSGSAGRSQESSSSSSSSSSSGGIATVTVGKKFMASKLKETLNSVLVAGDNVDLKSRDEIAACIQRARTKRMAHDRARKEKEHVRDLEKRWVYLTFAKSLVSYSSRSCCFPEYYYPSTYLPSYIHAYIHTPTYLFSISTSSLSFSFIHLVFVC